MMTFPQLLPWFPPQRTFLIFVFSLMSLTISACGGGGGAGSSSPPGTPTDLNITPGTSFRFTWNGVAGASAYRLLEDPTGSGTFAQVGGDLLTTSYFHSVPLWQRVHARYMVQE